MQVGFIGLGRMGHAMASRVLAADHDLVVWNRTRAKAEDLGVPVASSVAEACAGREVVITMLADDAALEEVVLGAGGMRDSLAEGAIHLAMGTYGVAVVQKLAAAHREAGQVLVAAPVLGRPDVAAEGQLGIVAAGPAESVERCRPLFDAIGRRTFAGGERPEGATAVKLANNFALGCAIETMGEAFALVRKYGIEPQVFYEVLTEGLFSAPAYTVYGKIIADEDYERVGFTVNLALKDVDLILAAADLAEVPLAGAHTYRERLLEAVEHGEGDHDWAVMASEQARASGLR